MKRQTSIEIICCLLIFLFIYAALSKGIHHRQFTTQLLTHPYLKSMARLLAWTVPGAELVTAVLLVLPRYRIAGLILSASMLAAFTAYLGFMLLSGDVLPCSCGGIIARLSWRQHLIFNLVFLFLSLAGIYVASRDGLHSAHDRQKEKRTNGYSTINLK